MAKRKQQRHRQGARRLTPAGIRQQAASESKRLEIADSLCRGLYLVVQKKPSGKKSFALRYRHPETKNSIKLHLGPWAAEETGGAEPEPVIGAQLSLASARRLAAKLSHEIAQGRDPVTEIKGERQQQRDTYTYADAARDYVLHIKKKHRRWDEVAAQLGLKETESGLEPTERGLCQRWLNLPVADVDEDAAFKVIDEARHKGIPGLGRYNDEPSEARARSMHSALSVLFAWLKSRRKVKVSPLDALKRPDAPDARERVLSDAEIKLFWQATAEVGEPFGSALRLMLITGQRREEVAGMRRSELSPDLAIWKLPAGRSKNKRDHAVPLPPLARDIISGVDGPDSDFLFTTTAYSPISGWSKTKLKLDGMMGDIEPWRIHDLRRTAVTGMARAGADLHVIERAVNHVSGSFGGIVSVYQKHKYEDDVRHALEAWANLLVRIVKGKAANVVELRTEA